MSLYVYNVLRYRWEVLPGIHLGKEGWGLQVPSLHTYSEGGEYSNLNPLWQEIEHCIVVGVLWQVATPLLGSAGLIHFPSATNNTGKSCQSWYRTQESIVHHLMSIFNHTVHNFSDSNLYIPSTFKFVLP